MEDKRKKYLRIFKTEADEHLTVINRSLVDLEQGSVGPEIITDILRAAHTLKGSSRMLGLMEIGDIAHKMEDIFKAIEDGELSPDPQIVDRLLEGADAITKLLEPGQEGDVDCEAVVSRLSEAMEAPSKKKTTKKKKVAKEKVKEQKPEGPAGVEAASIAAKPAAADTLRVEASRLDRLINIGGELLINKIKLENKIFSAKSILESLTRFVAEFDKIVDNGHRAEAKARLQEMRNSYHEFIQDLLEDVIELDVNVQEIQTGALQLRMIPAANLFDEFPRLVRDLARDVKKEIGIEIRGEDTELDKRLLEQLRGPLIHIVRNSCDHGIEMPKKREEKGKPKKGSLIVRAYHHGGSVVIEVEDDGAGMDLDRIRETALARGLIDERGVEEISDEEILYLTLRPGFSTSTIITDVSGRGVGLDVVKTNVEALRGDLNIVSTPGKGTKIELRLPLTVSIIEALLIEQGGEFYAIPLTAVEEVLRIKVGGLVQDRGQEKVPIRSKLLTLVRLGDLLGLPALSGHEHEFKSEEDMLHVIILKFRNQNLALEIDRPIREQEIVVKGLGTHLTYVPLISGATILRKGEPALILNVFDIFHEAEKMEGRSIKDIVSARDEKKRLPRILVVDDSITTRTIEKNILERANYEVTTAVSAEDALEKIEIAEPMFDLFVLDVDMAGLNGFELTERLRAEARTKNQPVIILTSRASDEDKRQGINVGAQAYIVKGAFDQNVLLNTVKSLIGD